MICRGRLPDLPEAWPLDRKIETLIRHFHGTKRPIDRSAELYHDMQLTGDDAGDLLDAVAMRFGTSFEGFAFDVYFPNETDSVLYAWARRFGFRDRRRKSLAVGHLIAVVEKGQWFEPGAS